MKTCVYCGGEVKDQAIHYADEWFCSPECLAEVDSVRLEIEEQDDDELASLLEPPVSDFGDDDPFPVEV